MLKHFSIFSFFTLVSKFCGFIRDMFISYFLGASIFSDIFFTAFKLPNLFRSLFAEGAFTASFVPIYSSILSRDKMKAYDFSNQIFTILAIALILLTTIVELNMHSVVLIFAPGFKNSEHFLLLVLLSRIMFPYIIFVALASLASGTLQARKEFAAISISPIILNLVIIIALFYSKDSFNSKIVVNLALCIIIAGSLQLSFMLFSAKKHNIDINFKKINMSEKGSNIKLFFKRMLPAALGSGVYQLNIFIDTFFASTVPLGVSYLYYADRICQLPLSLIGVSLSVVVLPAIAEAFNAKNQDLANLHQNKALKLALALIIPASAALFLLADIVIKGMFMNSTEFTLNSAIETAKTLQIFACALPAYVLNKIFLVTFFSAGDTKTPVIFAAISLAVNAILNICLISTYQHLGIAIASTISAWVSIVLILFTLRKKKMFMLSGNMNRAFTHIFCSTSCMIAAVEAMKGLFSDLFLTHNLFLKLILIAIIVVVGAAVYGVSYFVMVRYFGDKKSSTLCKQKNI